MIISELAKNSIKNRRHSSAVFYSVLVAVIILGTLLFIYSELELAQRNYHQKMFGDYHAVLYDINEEEYKQLQENANIKALEPTKVIRIKMLLFSVQMQISICKALCFLLLFGFMSPSY